MSNQPLDWRVPIVDQGGAPTSTFQRLWSVSAVPPFSGQIVLSVTTPTGWHVCDGTNGTPNLPPYSGVNFIMKL